ncbi:MAG TPA: hypothetical protein VGR06_09635 [Actinophytocola sp.]|jgi:hypothetical protein|uniref:DUF2017 family protein n=1 Tax=Actinophytocola sp. TaxID=1872138 RepID=UPI002E02D715|nr:hypothetical protein [Actinophytocola sp.]
MICWDRMDGRIVGIFTPRQIRWIRRHVGVLHAAAQDVVPLLGVPAWLAAMAEVGFDAVRRTRADTAVVLDTLPETGGVVVLPERHQAWAWIWTLSECQIHLAFRVGPARRPAQISTASGSGTEWSLSMVTTWLESVVDDLICVADLNYPAGREP